MCNGLALMHGRNVLHRDLKPKNVFLTGKNHLRLGDLGCAKLMKAGMARTQIGAFGRRRGRRARPLPHLSRALTPSPPPFFLCRHALLHVPRDLDEPPVRR